MGEPVRRWSLRVVRPVIVVHASCPPETALRVLTAVVTANKYRPRPSSTPVHLEATRVNWWQILIEQWPERETIVATATATADGCRLRIHYPTGNQGMGVRTRAQGIVNRTVVTLRSMGAQVGVGAWESGLQRQ